jgi:hypothetical protein
MALPIEPTPRLSEKASKRFLVRIEAGLKNPTHTRETPKLQEARKLALNHVVLGPKKDHK